MLLQKKSLRQSHRTITKFIAAAIHRQDAGILCDSTVLRETLTHHRDLRNLSKLSRVEQGNHYRSDPVRVQSTSLIRLLNTSRIATAY